jgi:rubrerythrin
MLSPKLNTSAKSIVTSLNKNGKIEVLSLIKDASIKSLLYILSKDLIDGRKNKETIIKLLEHSKPALELKSLSSDIKNIIQYIQLNPKLEKQVNILKQFQIDIKTIDDKILKSNISNSGVFLESKLLSSNIKISIPYNIKVALNKIEEQSDNITRVAEDIKDILLKSFNIKANNSKTNVGQTFQKLEITNITIKSLVLHIQTLIQQIKTESKLAYQITILKDTINKVVNLESGQNLQLIKSKFLINLTKPLEDIITNTSQTKEQIQNFINSEAKHKIEQSKILLNLIQSNSKFDKQSTIIKEFITNSTISEYKASTTLKSHLKNDIKAVLLQIQEQLDIKNIDTPKEIKAQLEKALLQIDFYQLSSYIAQSNKTNLPFNWDNNEDCDIEFKQNKRKKSFSCNINLFLKNHGEINIMLLLDDKNHININMNIQKDEFKIKLQDNMQIIRTKINDIGLSLQSLNIMNLKDKKNKSYEEKVYNNNIQNNFGVDIKA